MIGPTPETTVVAPDTAAWRAWLEKHHDTATEAWLVLQNKASPQSSVNVDDAVIEALCVGWIDSACRARSEHSRYLRFTPRRPRSPWSDRNRARAEELLAAGRMQPAGLAAIESARGQGLWSSVTNR